MEIKLRGRYKIIQKLGSGAFGDTYLALDEDLPDSPKRVVKHFQPKDPKPATLNTARRLFKQEAEILYRLKHEQIPQLYAYFEENGEFYLVEDYVAGDDLSKTELVLGKQLTEAEAIALLQDILEVLAYIHQQNVIHRDLKPQNLIRRRHDGKLFLIDFGAVKEIQTLMTNSQGQVSATVAIGTPGYMPSEQACGHPRLCSDVYSVGIIGIQALTGVAPYLLEKDSNTLEIIWRNRAQVSPQLAEILDRMVRYDLRLRYPSAVEALQAIASLNLYQSSFATQFTAPTKPPSLSYKKVALFIGFLTIFAVIFGLKKLLLKDDTFNFAKYHNPAYGITIQYPSSWSKQEINSSVVTNEIVEFISPSETDLDKFREKLVITVEDLSNPLSLKEYTNLSKQQITNQNQNVKILREFDSNLAGKRAYTVVYTVNDEQSNLKRMETWTLNNFKVYSIVYEAELDECDEYLPTAETMIKSLQFEN